MWHHILQLGHTYTITGLSMSSLKKSGQRIFVTGVSSCLLPYCAEQVREQPLDSAWQEESTQSYSLETAEQLSDSLELGVEEERPGSTKESKIISYVVRIRRVSLHPLVLGFQLLACKVLFSSLIYFLIAQAYASLMFWDSLHSVTFCLLSI